MSVLISCWFYVYKVFPCFSCIYRLQTFNQLLISSLEFPDASILIHF